MVNSSKFKDKKAIALVAIAFVLFVSLPVLYLIFIPINIGDAPVEITVEEGESSRIIAGTLKDNGLIRSETAFLVYLRLSGESSILKAGTYNFSGNLSVPDIVYALANGLARSEDIGLLISEGFNIWEIDERLAGLGLIKETDFSSLYYRDEGYLFPDTYRINSKAKLTPGQKEADSELLENIRERMRNNFTAKTAQLLDGLSLAESAEIIIIASMLEKEAKTEEDMKIVSGIIKNRLELGMNLQIDATVIYGACRRKTNYESQTKNCDVTFQGPAIEIKIDGPYNTYTRKGLPVGPISNPGLKAIEAALNPTETDYLYYLSTRDGSQMIYSKTAGEHAANRRKYLGL